MYCNNCGRENPDNVKFCCFCGAQTYSAPRLIEEIPQTPVENGQLDFEENVDISEKIDENPQIPEPISSVNSAGFAFPQPQPIIQQGVSPVQSVPQAAPSVNVSLKKADFEKNQGLERKYTLKHIIMCLVSTAVCAIAAGVFAGLYFSVI